MLTQSTRLRFEEGGRRRSRRPPCGCAAEGCALFRATVAARGRDRRGKVIEVEVEVKLVEVGVGVEVAKVEVKVTIVILPPHRVTNRRKLGASLAQAVNMVVCPNRASSRQPFMWQDMLSCMGWRKWVQALTQALAQVVAATTAW